MRIATWNINGLRSAQEQVVSFLESEKIDILCLQEIKVDEKRLSDDIRNFDGYQSYWFHAEKPGYSGVAVYTKLKPKKIEYGMDNKEFDREGRTLILHFNDFVLANFYFPHSGRELKRLNYKLKMNEYFLKYLDKLGKKVLICGDLNVAHQEIDLARPRDNIKNAGFTEPEREFMDKALSLGLIDIYRSFNPEAREYTWWSQRFGARERNIGWRIDYFLCYKNFLKRIKSIKIAKHILGSDHCPVIIDL
jgi:exodeoxyribonuclease-3